MAADALVPSCVRSSAAVVFNMSLCHFRLSEFPFSWRIRVSVSVKCPSFFANYRAFATSKTPWVCVCTLCRLGEKMVRWLFIRSSTVKHHCLHIGNWYIGKTATILELSIMFFFKVHYSASNLLMISPCGRIGHVVFNWSSHHDTHFQFIISYVLHLCACVQFSIYQLTNLQWNFVTYFLALDCRQ